MGANTRQLSAVSQSLLHRRGGALTSLVVLWGLLVAGLLAWAFHGWGFDDPYITYRYAANIAHGVGFVYNPGERILSTTAPFYALLLAGAGRLGLDIPLTSNLIGCVGLAVSGLALWGLGQVWQSPLVGVAGLVLYPTFPLLITTLGAETIFYLTLILLGFLACAYRRYTAAAVLLALATLTRADGIIASVAAGVYILVTQYRLYTSSGGDGQKLRALLWRAAGVYLGLLSAWFIFAWLYFGAPLPVTLAAKQRQGLIPASRSFFQGLWPVAMAYLGHPLSIPQLILAAVGVVRGVTRQRQWLLIVGWNLLYTAAYTALGVTSYFWYYAPLVSGFIVLVGVGIEGTAASRSLRLLAAPLVQFMLIVLLLIPQLLALSFVARQPDVRLDMYRTVGEWLHRATPPGASVGALEVGIMGYYAERRMVDFAGLIQPEVALRLSPSTGYDDAAVWALEQFRPDYIVLPQNGTLPRLRHNPAFLESCHSTQQFAQPPYPWVLVVYACVWE